MNTEKKYRLADFFNAHWDEYSKHPTKPIEPEQYKAVNAIRVCRTEALGVNYYVCPVCGEISKTFHSCKHRFCPTCSWKDTMRWAERIEQNLLNIKHRHVISSVPHRLIPIIKNNKKILHNILFRATAETFKDWFWNKYKLKTGLISVLHTFGEQKNWHSHIHSIVPWGGIDPATGELIEIKNEFVQYQFIRQKFRIKFEALLIEAFDNDLLKHNFADRIEFMLFVKSLNHNQWQIQIEKPIEKADVIIRYIGRYSKRACLSERKITNIEDEHITFSYKDNYDKDQSGKAKIKELRLHYNDFFPRLLQHVPPRGFQIVRYYGIYANSSKIEAKYRNKSTSVKEEKSEYKDPKFCYICNHIKTYLFTIFDRRTRQNRTEKFDIKKHNHQKVFIKTKQLYA